MPTILISGALANKPFNGGNAWSRLSWIRGFQALGWKAIFVEQIAGRDCVDTHGVPTSFPTSANRSYFSAVMHRFGLERSSALVCDGGRETAGLSFDELVDHARRAEALFNFGGHLSLPELRSPSACRIYFDDDPGFTQYWHAEGNPGPRLEGHDFYFTLGANIGASDCPIPTGEITWRYTRPPVVLNDWPTIRAGDLAAPQATCRFSTVASWRGAYAPVHAGGRTFGVKAHEFRKVMALPGRVRPQHACEFEIALQIHPGDRKDLEALRGHGWKIVDPVAVAGSPDAFRRYVQASGAEFSAAQGMYVDTNSGWFSDRTVRYLASGKPALVQATGFDRHIPVGRGLFTFRTLPEAVDAVDQITGDYRANCRAARELAEEYFDSGRVIRRLAGETGLTIPSKRPAALLAA